MQKLSIQRQEHCTEDVSLKCTTHPHIIARNSSICLINLLRSELKKKIVVLGTRDGDVRTFMLFLGSFYELKRDKSSMLAGNTVLMHILQRRIRIAYNFTGTILYPPAKRGRENDTCQSEAITQLFY